MQAPLRKHLIAALVAATLAATVACTGSSVANQSPVMTGARAPEPSQTWGPMAVLNFKWDTAYPEIGYSPEVGAVTITRHCVYYRAGNSRRLLLFNDVQGTWRPKQQVIRLHPWRGGHSGPRNRTVDLADGDVVQLASVRQRSTRPTMDWTRRPHRTCDTTPVQVVFNVRHAIRR